MAGETKHTPGPWSYGDGEILADGVVIAKVIDDAEDDEVADADGRLMAAAPEMYEALKDLHWAVEEFIEHPDIKAISKHLARANSALSLAEYGPTA